MRQGGGQSLRRTVLEYNATGSVNGHRFLERILHVDARYLEQI